MDVLTSITIFCRVVEAGSFSAVAHERDMSPSSVSKHITALEKRLGTQLLGRTTRQLSPTDAGCEYYNYCNQMLEELSEVEASVSRYQLETSGTLHLSIPVTFGELHITPALWVFHEKYPDMKIDLTMDDRVVDLVREGVDLAIQIGPLADSSMIARKIGSTERLFVASPEYLAKHGEPETSAELEQHNCVILSSMMAPGEWQYTGPKGKGKVQISGNVMVNNPAALREAVLAGVGLSAAPVWLVQEGIQQGKLKVILKDYVPIALDIHAVYRKRLYVQQKVVLMIDHLRETFKHTLKKIKV
ncbi:MAG: LysR family transcriptional regulator [Candidatus Thiodiazotropha sp. (ex Lucinoma borealis)]|nr:LysR family transcriptional regulator [Candidatus Thiodiazotropha sp. (ex Lucinoma borealis)]